METVYDWVTIAIFGGLIVLFLHRSMAEEPSDNILMYLPACVGCAFANYVGNKGMDWLAIIIIVAVLGYILHILKPIKFKF